MSYVQTGLKLQSRRHGDSCSKRNPLCRASTSGFPKPAGFSPFCVEDAIYQKSPSFIIVGKFRDVLQFFSLSIMRFPVVALAISAFYEEYQWSVHNIVGMVLVLVGNGLVLNKKVMLK